MWAFMIQISSKWIVRPEQNVLHCQMPLTVLWVHLSVLHLGAVLFLLPWTMRQPWVTWCTVELLRQLYWNLMETWPSPTSTQDIHFYASWTIAQCSHYSDRLETDETMKGQWSTADCVQYSVAATCSHGAEAAALGSALLWAYYSSKQAIILSATRLTCSWCKVFASSLRGFFFFFQQVFRELEEITGAVAYKLWYNTGTLSSGSITFRWNS